MSLSDVRQALAAAENELIAEQSSYYGTLFFRKHPDARHNYGMEDLAFQVFDEEEFEPTVHARLMEWYGNRG